MGMSSRERLMCSLHCGIPDRIPVSPQGLGTLDPNSPIAQKLIEETDIIMYSGGGVDPFVANSLRSSTISDGDSTITIYQLPNTELRRATRRTEKTSACVEFPCKSQEDVEALLEIPYIPPTEEQIEGAAREFLRTKDWLGDRGLCMYGIGDAICFPATWLSPEDLCILWHDLPDLISDMVRVANERLLLFVEELCKRGVDAFRIVGGEYASVQLGPKAFELLVKAPDTELVKVIHDYGALAYFHNHGPIMRYLEPIAEIGVDALDPLEEPPWGDCDIGEAKRILKGRVCLVGNLDDMEVLNKRPKDEVLRKGKELIEKAGPDGFVLSGTASGIYGEKAALNFLALAELVREISGSRS